MYFFLAVSFSTLFLDFCLFLFLSTDEIDLIQFFCCCCFFSPGFLLLLVSLPLVTPLPTSFSTLSAEASTENANLAKTPPFKKSLPVAPDKLLEKVQSCNLSRWGFQYGSIPTPVWLSRDAVDIHTLWMCCVQPHPGGF